MKLRSCKWTFYEGRSLGLSTESRIGKRDGSVWFFTIGFLLAETAAVLNHGRW